MMQGYEQQQKVLNGMSDQISLMSLYQQMHDPVQKTMLLSHLKHILLTTPNDIHIPAQQLKHCNDKYFYFILNQIIQWTTSQPNKSDVQKKQQQSLMRMMFYVVSLRIKLWFNKMEFEDVFSSLVINIQHNRKMIPMVVEFFIQLIDVFENKEVGDEAGERDKVEEEGESGVHAYNNNARRTTTTHHHNHHPTSRQSLTRKTNNSLFIDQHITRKTQRARKQLHQSIRVKSSYRKQNKFQRQFLDYQLNKLLTFANQCFNRAVVQNPKYDYEEQQRSTNQQQQELQPAYFIKMPIQHITKILQLIHRVLMFDFLGQRYRNLHDEYFQQKMPQIIPSKHTKYNRFEEIENWVKNKTDAYKYQYIYFVSNNIELKIQIVRIFGDMLRIHQKFFKRDVIFKTHVQTVVMLIKNMLQNLQIKYNQEFELAIVFGESINKLLLNSTFPTFLNSTKPQFKKQFIQSVSGFVHKEILDMGLVDVRLVRYYCGFFGEMYERLMINSSEHFRVKDFKQHVQLVVRRLTDGYEQNLYEAVDRNDDPLLKQFPKYYSINQTVKQLNMDNFEMFFTIFKYHQPKKHLDGTNFTLGESVLWICSRVQFNFYQYEYSIKQSQRDSKQVKKIDVVRRHCLQCFVRLVEVVGSGGNGQLLGNIDNTQQDKQANLMKYKYKVITSTFVCEKILSSKSHIVLIFQQSGQLFAFIKHVISIYFEIKLMLINHTKRQTKHQLQQKQQYTSLLCQQGSQFFNQLNNIHHHAQMLFMLVAKLTQHTLLERRKANTMVTQMRQLDLKIASTAKRQRQYHSDYTVGGKVSNKSRNHEDLQMVENMKKQCENGQKELEYFERIVRIIALVMGISNDSSSNNNSNSKQENQNNAAFESNQSTIIKKVLQTIIHEQRQLDPIMTQLYRMYFVTVSKYQLHRKMHCFLIKSNKSNQQAQHNSISEKQQQNLPPRKSQQSFYSQSSQHEDDDQCSVIQEQDVLVDNKQGNDQLHRCNTTIEGHNLHNDLTVVGYWVWLQYVLMDEQIKQELEEGFIDWFRKNNNSIFTNDNLNNKQYHTISSQSYLQLYSLQSIILRLVNQYYPKGNSLISQQTPNRILLLKITIMLMKLFRQSKYQIETKKHLLSAIIDFVTLNFYQIQKQSFVLQYDCDNYHRSDENSIFIVGQQQQDGLMAHRVQAVVNLLQSMVNLYFMQFTTNIFNVQFLTIFDYDQTANIDNQNNYETNSKVCTLQQQQLQWLINVFANTKSISEIFVNVINFVLEFPEEYLQNGWYKSIQSQLIRMIRQVYYEFSQFTTIFMFSLNQEVGQMEKRVMAMGLVKVHSPLNYNQQKYAVTINNTNLANAIYAYSILIEYINKVICLSYISSQSKQWLIVRNRQSLSFIKQIYQFICQLKKWNDKSKDRRARRQQQGNTRQQQQFYQSLTKLLKTMFEFIKYFLNNFQQLELQFVTEHLSLIETIYQMVDVSRCVGNQKIEEMIDGIVLEMNKVVVFRKVKEEEQHSRNNNNLGYHLQHNKTQHQHKPSASKKPSLSSSKKNKNYNSLNQHKLYQQQQSKHYKGWEYIKRLYQSSQTEILQEIETYQHKYKYRNVTQRKKLHTQGRSQHQDGTLTMVGSNKLQQSQEVTVYDEQENDIKSKGQDDKKSRVQNKSVMSSLKKIKPLLQQSSTINNERSDDEYLSSKDQYRQDWEQKQESEEQQYHNGNNIEFNNYHTDHGEDYYNQLQLQRKQQQQQHQEEQQHQQKESRQQQQVNLNGQQKETPQHSQQQHQQLQPTNTTNNNPPSRAVSSPPTTQNQLPIILQQSHKHIYSSKSKPSTAKLRSLQQHSQSIQQQLTNTNHNQQQKQSKSQTNQADI